MKGKRSRGYREKEGGEGWGGGGGGGVGVVSQIDGWKLQKVSAVHEASPRQQRLWQKQSSRPRQGTA